jgi:hypothetical protein
MKQNASLILSALVWLAAGNANAHIPNILPHDTSTNFAVGLPTTIEKSVAFYATFESPGDVDVYGFTLRNDSFVVPNQLTDIKGVVNDLVVVGANGKPGRLLHVGRLVPACPIYANILPTIAVVGPAQDALPAYDGSVNLPKSVVIGGDQGVMILQNPSQGPTWYEKFSYKSYFDQNSTDIILTEPGDYRIYVWNSNTEVGDYVLETGQVEVFGLPEIMQTLVWISHIIYDGEIGNRTCSKQLEELDGRNPSLIKIITDYEKMFGN